MPLKRRSSLSASRKKVTVESTAERQVRLEAERIRVAAARAAE